MLKQVAGTVSLLADEQAILMALVATPVAYSLL